MPRADARRCKTHCFSADQLYNTQTLVIQHTDIGRSHLLFTLRGVEAHNSPHEDYGEVQTQLRETAFFEFGYWKQLSHLNHLKLPSHESK